MRVNKLHLNLPKRSEEGFTLVELLVVIVIIGVLAAIALPIFLNQQKAAMDVKLKSDLKNVATATQTYLTGDHKRTNLNHDDGTVMGWHVVAFGSDDARFIGTIKNETLNTNSIKPPKFGELAVSEGVGVGVFSNTTTYRSFCVVGNAVGSNYDAINASVGYQPLYYDSMFGLMEYEELNADGPCGKYIGKVWVETVTP